MTPDTDLPFASVLVCTRNRSSLLTDACTAILELDYPSDRWELVIVDNHSTDDTLEVARSIERGAPDRVRLVEEHEIGLSAARNAAVRAARGEILAFIDDDAYPGPRWLRALVEALEQDGVLCAGGPVEPLIQGELPDWFLGRYLPYLSAWDRGPELARLVYNEYPRGANIAFRREAFERFGDFGTYLGRKGKSLLSGEEIELCLRVERAGFQILYVPDAGVRHVTPVDRLTPKWLARRFAAQGRSEAIINWRHAGVRGLRLGFRTYLRNAIGAFVEGRQSPDASIYARCQRHALVGYVLGAPRAMLGVPRYSTAPGTPPAAAWRPF